MKKLLFGAILGLLCPQITFSQTVIKPGMDAVKHTVSAGETVLDISKKYTVDPAEIYRANRFAIDGVKEGMVLEFYVPQKSPEIQIPTEQYAVNTKGNSNETSTPKIEKIEKVEINSVPSKVQNRGTHKVLPGETLYGLSKKYNVTVDELKNANAILMKNNLQAGQVLKIPDGIVIESVNSNQNKVEPKTELNSDKKQLKSETIKHTVLPKETLYGLSKKYNISIESIISQNEKVLKNGLQTGQVLLIVLN
ncbi:lytic transglycosylase [Flavobacterium sp.]|uniref:lytic transglycosylase n=1 Tax=Flavobacterium sp. TaxID=239 RepID=UPI002FD907EE